MVDKIETNIQNNLAVQRNSATTTDKSFSNQGLTDVFKKDSVNHKIEFSPQKESLSLWRRCLNFFSKDKIDSDSINQASQIKEFEKIDHIDRIPVLEIPSTPPSSHVKEVLKGKKPFSISSAKENEILMQRLTLEQMIISITKLRIEGSEEKGLVETATLEKYQDLKKVKKEELQKVHDRIQENQTWATYFGHAQNTAATASLAIAAAAGTAAALPTFGIAVPAFLTFNAVIPGVITGFSAALSRAGKTFFDQKNNERKAENTEKEYQHEILNEAASSHAQHMTEALEAITKLQGSLIELDQHKKQLMNLIYR